MSNIISAILLIAAFVAVGLTAPELAAQSTDSAVENAQSTLPSPNSNGGPRSERVSWMSDSEFALSVAVLAFGLLAICLQTAIIWTRSFQADEIVKIFGLSFIIISTLFIITAGYDSEQIAPAMGLFGTIAGYILGRNTKNDEVKKNRDQ